MSWRLVSESAKRPLCSTHSPSLALMRQWKGIEASTSTDKQHPQNTNLIRQYKQINDFLNHILNKQSSPSMQRCKGVEKKSACVSV